MPKSPSAAQKKKRLLQLRDAQRRRRERLREEKQHFVQIILPEETLAHLSKLIAETGETMQQAIARLVQSALGEETTKPPRLTPVPEPELESEAEMEPEIEVKVEATMEEDIPQEPSFVEVEEVLEIIEEMSDRHAEVTNRTEEIEVERETDTTPSPPVEALSNHDSIAQAESPGESPSAETLENPADPVPEAKKSTRQVKSGTSAGQLDLFG